MKPTYKKKFLKDVNNLPESLKKTIQKIVFEQIPEANSLFDVKGIKKLKGYKHFYRIRHFEYRIGIFVQGDRVIFLRVLHRKDIYKYFP